MVGLGRLLIFFASCGIAYGITSAAGLAYKEQAMLVVEVAVVTFITNGLFLGLFDEAILATLQCVAVDMDFNGGQPKYGSASFQTNMQIILDRDTDS